MNNINGNISVIPSFSSNSSAQPMTLEARIKESVIESALTPFEESYRKLVKHIFDQSLQELQQKIDDEKEPISW
ncbi:hypothetical protein [Rouxiella chamberiensis]|uniref:Uncharacterized protein n=1 Tax=Rouxiella chamberiensis TaxID=1513468 RepID=A0ABY7HUG0_9GAMM|nr:hypothetical protein [Rouxiella chamberiensis]WAT02679.1 hypothetical protein O1V66_09150 [Rouxiella chamberiensis]